MAEILCHCGFAYYSAFIFLSKEGVPKTTRKTQTRKRAHKSYDTAWKLGAKQEHKLITYINSNKVEKLKLLDLSAELISWPLVGTLISIGDIMRNIAIQRNTLQFTTQGCNKWSWTFIHRLFLLNSILLSLLLGSLLSDANQPGISTCNTHAPEYTGILFFICDLASLNWQAWRLDWHDWTLELHCIGQFSWLKFGTNKMTFNKSSPFIVQSLTVEATFRTLFETYTVLRNTAPQLIVRRAPGCRRYPLYDNKGKIHATL